MTSDYHTARARRIFLGADTSVAAVRTCAWWLRGDQFFTPDDWWHSREGRKTVFMEWTKTLASAFGI